ncbi:polymer-forming cytoskeletal protein [Massilia oculi]|uniref:polymer-forming cytoskeletal protein n=1 Tax=Massilia oculi TaxID=945844 RepID=UPI0028AFFAB8|nr:polymer-forming cytoskeletal protein [Massilia oculi]
MHFASVLSTVSTRAPLRRLWSCLLLVLGLCLMDAARAGKTYSFDGGKVLNCSNKAKVYTCPTLQLPEWDDKMVIGDGYTVDVNADVGFGWNHGLRMSGTARLTSTGSINLTGLAPGSLVVNGGSFEAGGTFSVAGPTPFKADVTAGTLSLGTGTEIQITGKMVSRGAVSVASYTTIVGPVSGTSITTNSPFKITGEVKASDTLLIASGAVIDGPVSGTNSITINSPATLSSTVTSQGPVQIGSHANIGGAVKGTVITADSPVTLKGDITATSRFTLGSGSTVSGNIVAPEVELYASQSNITGNITASKLLTMGDSVKVKGTVDTGTLTMYAASAMIEGIAKVNFATLYWNGRVTQPIVCKAGTRPGYCDCVDNQSGNPVNTANGPRCESAQPETGTFSHFLIEHDGNDVATCSTKSVTVRACANGDCSQRLATPTKVIMQPGGASANFIGSGTVQVSSARKGVNKLSLTLDGAATQFKCYNTKSKSYNCDVNFTGDVGFRITVPHHKAGNWVTAELQALRSDGAQCKPAFANVSKQVQYTCNHSEPTSGDLPVMLARTATNPANPVELMCSANRLVLWDTVFDDNAKAEIGLTYTDAGKVTLGAKTDEISGAGKFTVAPDHFDIVTPSPLRAGLDFDVTLTARNASGATTPNFSKASYPTTPNATLTTVSMSCNTGNGAMPSVDTEFTGGEAKVAVNFPEAGWINLQAESKEFLDSGKTTTSATGSNAPCMPKVGPFVPMYFQVELNDTARILSKNGKDLTYYYSREPIPLKITAMNAKGEPTTNYPSAYGSDHAFSLSAVGVDGAPLEAGLGALAATLAASDFDKGIAKPTPSRKSPQATYQFTNAHTAPTQIRLRVENKAATGALPAGHGIKSADDPAYTALAPEKARPEIRSGRLRIASRFGRIGAPLMLPVTAEYWTGQSWVLNDRDGFSLVPSAAIAQTAFADTNGNGVKPQISVPGNVQLSGGKADLQITGSAAGWIDIAFNLGAGATQDQSCLKVTPVPATNGAGLPWLQSTAGCVDPSGRATFGIFAPESRRIIHVREVFN